MPAKAAGNTLPFSEERLPAKGDSPWHRGQASPVGSLGGRGLCLSRQHCAEVMSRRNEERGEHRQGRNEGLALPEKFLPPWPAGWAHFCEAGTVLGTGDLVINEITSLA